jgi:hypothetical protein
MKFRLVLVGVLFSLATANAQTSQSQRSPETQAVTPGQKANSKSTEAPIGAYRECDPRGCCLYGSMDRRCAPTEFEKAQQTAQDDLQRRAEELRKKLLQAPR